MPIPANNTDIRPGSPSRFVRNLDLRGLTTFASESAACNRRSDFRRGHRHNRLAEKNPHLLDTMPELIVLDPDGKWSRNRVKLWMLEHQDSRRNSTDAQRRFMRGEIAKYRGLVNGTNQFAKKPSTASEKGGCAQGAQPLDDTTVETATQTELAAQLGVSRRTLQNDIAFAEAVNAVAESQPDAQCRYSRGEIASSKVCCTAPTSLLRNLL